MKTIKIIITIVSIQLLAGIGQAQQIHRNIKTDEYKQLQQKLCVGWNTWSTNSVISHVLLPEAFSINLSLKNCGQGNSYLRETYKSSKAAMRSEEIKLGLRSDDGSYTSLELKWDNITIIVQSAIDGEDLVILITPENHVPSRKTNLIIEEGILWNREGSMTKEGNTLVGRFNNRSISVGSCNPVVNDSYALASTPYLAVCLDNEIGIFTGNPRDLDQIKAIVSKSRTNQEARVARYVTMAEPFKAMQTILAWNTVYDPGNNRVISPVSRHWNAGFGGYVLFDWDTYFASYMLSMYNKDLAYANAIEITKSITPQGFIPNYAMAYNHSSFDRSQPPIGSYVILQIFKKYREKWFLEEVYDELLSWNRWWPEHRDNNGYLCWGSDLVDDKYDGAQNTWQGAAFESGLDNSPMYDNVPFNNQTHLLELADVGLISMYIMDCNSLAEISDILGRKRETDELKARSASYTKTLATLWDENEGIFFNKRTDTGEKNRRISPTNFYPMLAKACTQAQAERMMKEHYFNPSEFYGEYVMPSVARNDLAFNDNNYWRGRIWAPMNFLVYMGMCNYNVPDAKADMVKKSMDLLMKSWNENGAIYENYNGLTGQGDDVLNANPFYHWGALLSFMSFIENGYPDLP
jgi:putative isomerase